MPETDQKMVKCPDFLLIVAIEKWHMPPQKSQPKSAELFEKIFSRTIFAHLDYIRNMRRIHNFEKNYVVSLIVQETCQDRFHAIRCSQGLQMPQG